MLPETFIIIIRKVGNHMTNFENEAKMRELRKGDEAFDTLVNEITCKIEQEIKERNAKKSFYPTGSNDYKVRIKVKAVPITKEEKTCLLRFLENHYSKKVLGNVFTLEKCWFSEQYEVRSKSFSYL